MQNLRPSQASAHTHTHTFFCKTLLVCESYQKAVLNLGDSFQAINVVLATRIECFLGMELGDIFPDVGIFLAFANPDPYVYSLRFADGSQVFQE